MNSVIIVAPAGYEAELIGRARRLGATPGLDGLVVARGTSRAFLYRADSVGEELGPERYEKIAALIGAPEFYLLDFSGIELCKDVLRALVNDAKLLVDNDVGVCVSGPEFLRLLEENPTWDWR